MAFIHQKIDDATKSAEQIKKWLHECTLRHPDECNNTSSVRPTRLIFFESGMDNERLITVDQQSPPTPYIALSYCWGREENLTTTPANLQEMQREIPHDCLPQTLKDVFSMVRLLNFRYLWIDALCIVQDEHGVEWKNEAAKMGDIYGNASLVLSAMASPSVHSGLFVEMTEYSEEQKNEFHRIMRTCRTMTQKEWHNSIKDTYPLLCRGWAFQERLLARRIVHFTLIELIWECMEDRWCECEDENGALSGKINNMNSALRVCRADPIPTNIRLMWRECVKSFSRRDLTRLHDRLYAIDGIASFIRGPDPRAYNEQYFHGLWKDALPWDLLWYCDQTSPLKREKSPRSPSYCWSSVDCGIEWQTCTHWLSTEKFSLAISTGTCFEFRFKERAPAEGARFCDATIATDGRTLLVTSRMAPVLIKEQYSTAPQKQLTEKPSLLLENINSRNSQALPFYPDIQLDNVKFQASGTYYYVEIASLEGNDKVRQAGIVVRPKNTQKSGNQPQLYERVGLAGCITCDLGGNCPGWLSGEERNVIALI